MFAVFPALLTLLAAGGAAAPGPAGPPVPRLSDEEVETFAGLALACIDREWPYKTGHVLVDAESLKRPRHFHPVFYGCYDWHSAAHGHWMLVRLLRTRPAHPLAEASREALRARFTPEAFRTEAAFFERPHSSTFERPYGWAWLLRLAQELRAFEDDEDATRWAKAIEPLERKIVAGYREYLPKLTWPIRTGEHPNTAFALSMAHDYARGVGDEELERLVRERALAYFGEDRDAPVHYEPSGHDFFSPILLEADLMRRVLPPKRFASWLSAFLPGVESGRLGGLSEPATVSDVEDPKIVHLDGLNLVRGWTLDGIAHALAEDDPRRARVRALARRHAEVGLSRVTSGHYEGEHWLASFAVYLATRAGVELPTNDGTSEREGER
jgi:hypothetical protein